jgi:hypothetical protein
MAKREIFICDLCKKEIDMTPESGRKYGKAIISFKDFYYIQSEPLNVEICNECGKVLYDKCCKEIQCLKSVVRN